jgi:predicted AlkP superfamily phosphohydrolase/phosphomutase
LIAGIEAIVDDRGRPIGSKAYRPEDIYRSVNGVAPDLIVYFGDLDWRSVGAVGMDSIYTFENDTGPDEANHDWYGIFVMSSPNGPVPLQGNLGDVSIYDVAPTLLTYFGLPVPADMIGRSLVRN